MARTKPHSSLKKPPFFFMVVATTHYRKEGDSISTRKVNIMLQLPTPNITQNDLRTASGAVQERLKQENGVEFHQVVDMVFDNIFPLANMNEKDFHNVEDQKSTGRPN